MNIKNISAALDNQLLSIEKQLKQLHEQLAQQQTTELATSSQTQLEQDIAALSRIREKLIKSKDLAWRAHELSSSQPSEKQRARQRLMGLSLISISLIGGMVLLYIALN
jgi:hypothetical protein